MQDLDILVVWRHHTRRQISLYRMFFADFSVNSQPIFMEFYKDFIESRGDYREIFIKNYYLVQKLDHLTSSKFEITASLYKPIKLVKLKGFFSPELHYMPDGLTF